MPGSGINELLREEVLFVFNVKSLYSRINSQVKICDRFIGKTSLRNILFLKLRFSKFEVLIIIIEFISFILICNKLIALLK